jgi:hypothetical protein
VDVGEAVGRIVGLDVGALVWVGVAEAPEVELAVALGVGAADALWQEAEPLSVNEPVACWKLQS